MLGKSKRRRKGGGGFLFTGGRQALATAIGGGVQCLTVHWGAPPARVRWGKSASACCGQSTEARCRESASERARERERERESELHTVPLCERHCRRLIGGEDFREGFENQLGIQTGVHKRLQRQRARLLSRFSDPGI